jgi:hypothetical protein
MNHGDSNVSAAGVRHKPRSVEPNGWDSPKVRRGAILSASNRFVRFHNMSL